MSEPELEDDQIYAMTMKGKNASQNRPEEMCHKFFIWKIRFLHAMMGCLLTYIGLQHADRHDAAVWIVSIYNLIIIMIVIIVNIFLKHRGWHDDKNPR